MSMIKRSLILILPLAAAAALVFFLLKPGTIEVEWGDAAYKTNIAFALSVLIGVGLVFSFLIQGLGWILHWPSKLWERLQNRRLNQALEGLKVFFSDRFNHGDLFQESQALEPLLRCNRTEVLGEYLLGQGLVETDQDKQKASIVFKKYLCEMAVRRGDWDQVLQLCEDVSDFRIPPLWAFYNGIRAHMARGDYHEAWLYCHQSLWDERLPKGQRYRLAGAIGLEEALNHKGSQVHIDSQKVQYSQSFWPLTHYALTMDFDSFSSRGLAYLEAAWAENQNLAVVHATNHLYGVELKVDGLLKEIQGWEIFDNRRQEDLSLLVEGTVLTYGKVWGRAKEKVEQSLSLNRTREGLMLLAEIQDKGFGQKEKAIETLKQACCAPCRPEHEEFLAELQIIPEAFPKTLKYLSHQQLFNPF